MRRILDLQFLSKNLNFRIFIKIVCGFISRKIHDHLSILAQKIQIHMCIFSIEQLMMC